MKIDGPFQLAPTFFPADPQLQCPPHPPREEGLRLGRLLRSEHTVPLGLAASRTPSSQIVFAVSPMGDCFVGFSNYPPVAFSASLTGSQWKKFSFLFCLQEYGIHFLSFFFFLNAKEAVNVNLACVNTGWFLTLCSTLGSPQCLVSGFGVVGKPPRRGRCCRLPWGVVHKPCSAEHAVW